jgi:hypothetical protein
VALRPEPLSTPLSAGRIYRLSVSAPSSALLATAIRELETNLGRVPSKLDAFGLEFPPPADVANNVGQVVMWVPFDTAVRRGDTLQTVFNALKTRAQIKRLTAESDALDSVARAAFFTLPIGTPPSAIAARAGQSVQNTLNEAANTAGEAARKAELVAKLWAVGAGLVAATVLGTCVYLLVAKTDTVAGVAKAFSPGSLR